MYLARHVGGWSTTVIGRLYNGRDHSTVCYCIQRIEAMRESEPEVDLLLTDLKQRFQVIALMADRDRPSRASDRLLGTGSRNLLTELPNAFGPTLKNVYNANFEYRRKCRPQRINSPRGLVHRSQSVELKKSNSPPSSWN